ncbi:BTAD domain-containing putative transcriptional regulator [Micromonospora sp. WMMD1128]|uniref:AfsR/SARP family transcriptional regulator n=1 Tax=Micromonospora sp. WMMD1128 TaxID=3015150 RepID=UPI00248B9F0A|nr:BTAD domain-containing putative transcriptional regulator [Micromonospora sp. WMMD1128]WBB76090.1 BTAD domain-containing putative transcriptional regulator [Micromonospora sp. WMMD1128]
MHLHFALLGPLTLAKDGVLVALGSAKQQLVLAALLLRPGEAIPADELAAMVWGDRPPASAAANIRTYLRGLRMVLGGAAGTDRIRTTPGGYLLWVGPGERDLDRFDAAAARGRAALAAGDPAGAQPELADALGLWRGPALSGLPLPRVLAGRVDRLEERRLLVEEDAAAAGLSLGDAARVVPRLRALLDRHPLRQRAWAQLMTGLYQLGDVSGALAAFRQARQVLVEETGMDPGPELTRLHDDILHHRLGQRPATTGAAGATVVPAGATMVPAGATVVPPRQLPLAVAGFVGRGAEIAVLDAALGRRIEQPGAVNIVTVSGMAGVGKTTLALHWAHHAVDRFPDGQLYVNLRGYDDGDAVLPADALLAFLETLGVPTGRMPSSIDARAGLFRSLLASRRMLVLLDNARDATQVRPLLPGAGRCAVLVTSRDQLTGLAAAEGARPVTLGVLTAGESTLLLRRRLGDGRVAADPAATAEMIESTGRLPLALSIVAARVAARPAFPLDAVAAQLRSPDSRLRLLAGGDVRRVFSWSYRALSADAARLLRLLGLHPGPDLTGDAVAALVGGPGAAVAPLLAELTRLHLLTEHRPDRYALHDLLRSYAVELTQSYDRPEERRDARHRMFDHYLRVGLSAAALLQPTWTPVGPMPPQPTDVSVPMSDRAAAEAWFQAERFVLLRVLRQTAATGFERHTGQFAWALAAYLAPRGLFQDQLAVQRVALDAAKRVGDLGAQALARRMLARALMRLGDQDTAEHHLRRAIELYEQLGDLDGLALILRHRTELCTQTGRLAEALGHSVEALRVSRLIGNDYAEARALNNKGYLHALTGDHRQAVVDCTEALARQRRSGDRVGQASTLDSLGFAYHRLGDPARAAACYEQAVRHFVESANRFHEALTLIRLGEARAAMADVTGAVEAWQRALRIYDDLGDPAAEEIRGRLAGLPPG